MAVLCILRELALHRQADGSFDLDAFKVVYVAPMKSLVQEIVLNLGNRFAKFGLQVKELTGDQQLNKQQIMSTQVFLVPCHWLFTLTRCVSDHRHHSREMGHHYAQVR